MTSQGSSRAPSNEPMPHSHICSPDMVFSTLPQPIFTLFFLPETSYPCPISSWPHSTYLSKAAQMLYGYKLNYVLCSFRCSLMFSKMLLFEGENQLYPQKVRCNRECWALKSETSGFNPAKITLRKYQVHYPFSFLPGINLYFKEIVIFNWW